MAFLAWTPSLELGFPGFDKQHRQLVGLLNELHDAMRAGRGKDATGKILASLIHYTKTHFAEEEAFMQQRGYPGLVAHRAEHTKLTAQVVDAQRRFLAGEEATLTIELMQFLGRWMTDHIQGSDRKYKDFIATAKTTPIRSPFAV